ncbi:hypothetical protein AC062_1288 [Pasteurellaceae bacterium NI1060]|nr:hypothetical protein AC062_1288 [Pasteurellaceae bacterium NI1060]
MVQENTPVEGITPKSVNKMCFSSGTPFDFGTNNKYNTKQD